MIQKSIEAMDLSLFDRIIVTIVRPHIEQYDADVVLRQAFENTSCEVCALDDFTSGAAETVYQTLTRSDVSGAFVVRDSDNMVQFDTDRLRNFVVGLDLNAHSDVSNVAAKSFLVVNDQNIVVNIVEKRVVSGVISLGAYGFHCATNFKTAYDELSGLRDEEDELYVSHVIAYMIGSGRHEFDYIPARFFEDWGTIDDWKRVQKRYRTYFVDIDGVVMKNSGKYGRVNWGNNGNVLSNNLDVLKKLSEEGGQIVFTTCRPPEFTHQLEEIFTDHGLENFQIVTGLNHSQRVLINDFAPTNPHPSCLAVNMPRNGSLAEYLD